MYMLPFTCQKQLFHNNTNKFQIKTSHNALFQNSQIHSVKESIKNDLN